MEVDKLLASVVASEEGIANLPNESLERMLQGLQVWINIFFTYLASQNNFNYLLQLILLNLKQQRSDLNELESKTRNDPNFADQEPLLKQLKQRVNNLIPRAEQGVALITVSFTIVNSW